jgi:pimeloyl-ACP methyl ester carboxylesterase
MAGLAALAGSTLARARTVPSDLALHDFAFDRTWPFVHRAMVLAPTHLPADTKVPVLVLLHGLGEAKEGHASGTFAWLDRYGAGSSYARLRSPPLASVEKRKDLTDDRATTLNAELAARPFGGLVLVCPFTPNVWSFKSTEMALDKLTEFITGDLMSRVGREIAVADTTRVGLDGCSLGGFVALEVFARKAERFATVGVVQPAISSRGVPRYADVIAAALRNAPLGVHVESSKADPYLRVSQELVDALGTRSVTADFIAPPGPHDQPFLRDVGTLEMLLWHDKALRR